jgi:TPP-dependent indolepyruvate ferredoxin oxidoreductase alpha subunit
MQQGLMQQGLQQALIDAARQQYAGYTGAPLQALTAPLAALGKTPDQYTETKQNQAGLLSYIQALSGMGAFGR